MTAHEMSLARREKRARAGVTAFVAYTNNKQPMAGTKEALSLREIWTAGRTQTTRLASNWRKAKGQRITTIDIGTQPL